VAVINKTNRNKLTSRKSKMEEFNLNLQIIEGLKELKKIMRREFSWKNNLGSIRFYLLKIFTQKLFRLKIVNWLST
jgi:hypothetical protein